MKDTPKDTPTHFKSEPNLKGSDLTDEEAAALDEYYTSHVPKVGPNEGGFFANPARRLMPVDELSAAYIRSACEATHKTPAEIIGQLVREKIAASA